VTRPVRLGAVSYLNVRPLVEGLDRDPAVSLRFDTPAVCAERLARGEIDLGMVPSITYADRPGDRIVAGACIGSEGPVDSVALYSRRPLRDARSIALDTSSRTSAALTRILCARRWQITPDFLPHAPDLPAMLAVADAALLIGDPALFLDHRAAGATKTDLGDEWTSMTGLPFVWAFWSGPAAGGPDDRIDASVVRRLHQARDAGVVALDAIADGYCAGDPARQGVARRYLREHMRYDLNSRALDGLRLYYQEAHTLGLIGRTPSIDCF
jgi:predicted solute-binding protein